MSEWRVILNQQDTQTYTYSDTNGSAISVDVSAYDSVRVNLNGAGGGDGTVSGGSGGFIRAAINTESENTLQVYPGGGGTEPAGGDGYYTGGDGGSDPDSFLDAGGGGGSTTILDGDGTELVHADGGGGGSRSNSQDGVDYRFGGGGGARGGTGGTGSGGDVNIDGQDGGGSGFGGDGGDETNTTQTTGESGGAEAVDSRVTVLDSETGGGNNGDGEITITPGTVLNESDGLYDARTVDTFNPFGDYATAWFDDLEGEIFEQISRGTKITFEYDDGDGYVQDFVGFVVNDFENEADGAEQLEVEAYTFDQFLRGDEISNSQEGKLISEALEDVIKTDVPPVDWDASLVDVEDDIELTRSYQGENVEEFLLDLRQKSGGEFPSVTEDLKFEWKRPEIERTERDIDNTQWITHDISEQGGDTKNQITVVFDDGDRAVTVDESGDQLQTQENLGASGPAQQAADPLVIDDITTIDDAIDAGERFLQRRESTITGPVTTFGLNSAEPGNVIGVTIEPRGIDSEFRIAENRTRWRGETNELVVVQRKGADDDILLEQTDRVRRVEGRSRDLDVTPDRVTDTKPTAEVSISASTDSGVSSDISRFVNDGRNALLNQLLTRGSFLNTTPGMAFSTDGSRPSRSDSSTASVDADPSATITTNPQSLTIESSTTASNIQRILIYENFNNVLLGVARLSEPVDSPSVTATIDFSNKNDNSKSVWTNEGLNLLRDYLEDSAVADDPEFYSYGSGTSEPDPTQTSLDTNVLDIDLDTVRIQSADTESEWGNITDIDANKPVIVDGTNLQSAQICFTTEGENFDRGNTGSVNQPQDTTEFSDGNYASLSTSDHFVEYDFTLKYDVPANSFELPVRLASSDTSGGSAETDFALLDASGSTIASGGLVGDGGTFPSPVWVTELGTNDFPDVLPAGQYTLLIDCVTNQSALDDQTTFIDVVAPRDTRFNTNLSETLNADGYLPGPEKYPESVTISLTEAFTRRNVTEASFTSTWNNTDNSQYIELANDGSTFTRFDNSTTGSVTFASADRGVDVTIGFSRYSETTTQTPVNGNDPQQIDTWSLNANPDTITNEDIGVANVRAIAEASEAVDDTFAEAGLKGASGDMLTRSLIPQFVKSDDQLVVSSERLRWEND